MKGLLKARIKEMVQKSFRTESESKSLEEL